MNPTECISNVRRYTPEGSRHTSLVLTTHVPILGLRNIMTRCSSMPCMRCQSEHVNVIEYLHLQE